jgi:outer membrane protein assembly factor BamB
MSLGEAVAQHGPWPEAAVLALGAGLAEALEAIHAAGVVHRDLKPSNVLLASDGPRVIDFGISVTDEGNALTQTGTVVGTPGFMSPEQLASGRQVGAASDVFSLGAVLAFAATGAGPFGSGTPHALHYRIVHEEPDLTALPPVLGTVVARCTAKDPQVRPTVAELLAELAAPALQDEAQEPFQLRSEHGWLPQPVALALQERSRPGSASPPEQPEQPDEERASGAGPAAHEAPTRSGRTLGPGPVHPPTALATPAPVPAAASVPPVPATPPPAPPVAPPAGAAADRTRRQLLVAAAALGTAGIGFTGWKLLGGAGGDTGDASPGDSPGKGSGGGDARGGKVKGGTRRWAVPEVEATASPTVVDGTAYVSAFQGLRAFDTADGKHRWTFPLEAVRTRPAVSGDTVHVVDGGRLYAVNATDGKLRWSSPFTDKQETAPVVADGTVYIGDSGGTLRALDAATGRRLWAYRFPWDGNASSTLAPVVADGTVYIGGVDGTLHAVDAATGRRRWTHPSQSGSMVSTPAAVADGTVYYSGGRGGLDAVDAASGKRRWSASEYEWSAPVVADGTVFLHEFMGDLFALDATNGKRRWTFPVRGSVHGAPAVGDGTVCFGGQEGVLYAVDAATGRERWSFDAGSKDQSDGTQIKAPPVIAGGTVYFTAADDLLLELPTLYAVAL